MRRIFMISFNFGKWSGFQFKKKSTIFYRASPSLSMRGQNIFTIYLTASNSLQASQVGAERTDVPCCYFYLATIPFLVEFYNVKIQEECQKLTAV